MKRALTIVGYGFCALLILAGLGGDKGTLIAGLILLLGMLAGTDAWGLRTRVVQARLSPEERKAAQARAAQQAQEKQALKACPRPIDKNNGKKAEVRKT